MTIAQGRALVAAALLASASLLAGCESYPVPSEPPPAAQTVSAEGLSLTALAGRWRAFPPDLARYYLPIETFASSDRADAVPLRLEDFALLDASGRETKPVSPREATAALFGAYGRQSGLAPGATVVPARTSFFFHGRFGYPFGYYGPFYPYYYPYYSPYYDYWPPPPPAYRGRSFGELTGDLVRLGVAEGRLEAKGSVHGFLYFARVEGDPTGLRLRWAAPGVPAPLVAPVAGGG